MAGDDERFRTAWAALQAVPESFCAGSLINPRALRGLLVADFMNPAVVGKACRRKKTKIEEMAARRVATAQKFAVNFTVTPMFLTRETARR